MILYTDVDPKVCAWATELVRRGLVPHGEVVCRSIKEWTPDELRPYTQVHHFAGILGWPYALQLAGWPADRPVWTASCPCQPFSSAGKRKGAKDDRHLWPDLLRLVRACRPECLAGEQVASAVGHGWLDGVFADLEAEGYACGAVVLGAHSVGAPHIRQRIYWVADAECVHDERRAVAGVESGSPRSAAGEAREWERSWSDAGRCGTAGRLADAAGSRRERTIGGPEGQTRDQTRMLVLGKYGEGGRLEHPASDGRQQGRAESVGRGVTGGCGVGRLGDADDAGPQGRGRSISCGERSIGQAEPSCVSHWANATSIPCGDGKTRRLEPGLSPLVDGTPARVVRLRGYGNAIVPQVAAEFIKSYLEVKECGL